MILKNMRQSVNTFLRKYFVTIGDKDFLIELNKLDEVYQIYTEPLK
jgi:hypothetical protein